MHHVRRVPVAEWDAWAVVRTVTDPERPCTGQELLNRGFFVLDRYAGHVWADCSVVDWRRRTDLPGVVLAEGYSSAAGPQRPSRYDRLPAAVRARVLRVRVRRPARPDHGRSGDLAVPDEWIIPADLVEPDDEILDERVPPHAWLR